MKRFAKPFLLLPLCAALSAHADEAELRARIEKLSAELEQLRSEIKNLHSQTEAIATQQEKTAVAPAPAVAMPGYTDTAATPAGQVAVWGYGEINYNRPKNDGGATTMDLRRAVFGFGYRFNEKTRFMSEFEIEHAVSSADDKGEVEVEQFYIDHQLADYANLKAGLFLIPMGLLNESHEPTHYYGVERNFVETAIIPSTWREGGAAVYGSTAAGLAWDVGLTTGFDLGKWDPAAEEGRESPLGSIHQELQLAKARDLSQYVALNFRGVPGWVLGGTVFTGKVSQGNPDIRVASNARLTLWDMHTRWTPGDWDLSALYARGTISDTKDLNLTFVGKPTPIPKAFFGWYTQAAYKVWQSGTYALSPFVRYERFNTAADYEAAPAGLGVDTLPTEAVWTYGFNFNLNPNVVIKTDYQRFKEDSSRNRFDLGLGLAF